MNQLIFQEKIVSNTSTKMNVLSKKNTTLTGGGVSNLWGRKETKKLSTLRSRGPRKNMATMALHLIFILLLMSTVSMLFIIWFNCSFSNLVL